MLDISVEYKHTTKIPLIRVLRTICYYAQMYRVILTVTADILAHQVLLNRVPEQATEDSVRYQIYY